MQTVKHSWIEVLCNIGTGFLISAGIQQWVITPIWHLPVSAANNLTITAIFTVVSILRSYVFRRVFNKIGHKS